jgi:uncharacterized protein YutE (UPF0331/DUF86 family)
MVSLAGRIKAELENIDETLKGMPTPSKLPYLSSLELAGTATLLHNFYNGVENILKQIFISKKIPIPEGGAWHKDLLEMASDNKIISEEYKDDLMKYLVFRHFFSHGYALDLHADKMESLVEDSAKTYSLFREEIKNFL